MHAEIFQDIVAWKKSHELVLLTYKLTEKYPRHELFSLTNQSRRCAVSVPSNIAEGFRRKTKNDKLHFYNIAQSSLEELRYQMMLAKDLGYITPGNYLEFVIVAESASKLLNAWVRAQK